MCLCVAYNISNDQDRLTRLNVSGTKARYLLLQTGWTPDHEPSDLHDLDLDP